MTRATSPTASTTVSHFISLIFIRDRFSFYDFISFRILAILERESLLFYMASYEGLFMLSILVNLSFVLKIYGFSKANLESVFQYQPPYSSMLFIPSIHRCYSCSSDARLQLHGRGRVQVAAVVPVRAVHQHAGLLHLPLPAQLRARLRWHRLLR